MLTANLDFAAHPLAAEIPPFLFLICTGFSAMTPIRIATGMLALDITTTAFLWQYLRHEKVNDWLIYGLGSGWITCLYMAIGLLAYLVSNRSVVPEKTRLRNEADSLPMQSLDQQYRSDDKEIR